MNRDGYRAGRRTAEHEAAHAVIGTLSGCVVAKVSIAPTRAQRDEMGWQGWADVFSAQGPWPVPLAKTADIDVSAAGLAWELLQAQKLKDWQGAREAWQRSHGDREDHSLLGFLRAVLRVRRTLKRPEVAIAVRQTADALQARKSGEIFGVTVEKIVSLAVPSFAHQVASFTGWAYELDPAAITSGLVAECGLTASAGLTADGAR